jgi:cytochrome c biogenesis protein CcdA/glutaredoxin
MALKISKLSIILLTLVMLSLISPVAYAQEQKIDIVYFYGDGCPHCANFEEWVDEIKDDYNINLIGFEVYSDEDNRELAIKMAEEYGESFTGVPMIFIDDDIFIGFSEGNTGKAIKEKLDHCIQDECCDSPMKQVKICEQKDVKKEKLTFASVMTLAFADSLNPCALAVLAMALMALLAKDPRKKKKVLLGGLAFISAVFITYLIYGGIIIQFFKTLATVFSALSVYVRYLFAIVAIFLGVMNLKDFFKYKPGSLGTEMPIKLRPMVKRIISNITRPGGAFIIGILVTLFLLPCTIGPYLVVGNILSGIGWLKVLPWLLFYNLIFVLPMILVTLLVYFGMTKVQDVSKWKDKNVRWIHFVSGIVIFCLGIAMLLGWV